MLAQLISYIFISWHIVWNYAFNGIRVYPFFPLFVLSFTLSFNLSNGLNVAFVEWHRTVPVILLCPKVNYILTIVCHCVNFCNSVWIFMLWQNITRWLVMVKWRLKLLITPQFTMETVELNQWTVQWYSTNATFSVNLWTAWRRAQGNDKQFDRFKEAWSKQLSEQINAYIVTKMRCHQSNQLKLRNLNL